LSSYELYVQLESIEVNGVTANYHIRYSYEFHIMTY